MKQLFLTMLLCVFAAAGVFADQADKAAGLWKSIDEKGKLTAFWSIVITNDILKGTILHSPGTADSEIATNCKGEFKGKTYVGTYWIFNMKKTGSDSWGNGTIIDPEHGDVYGCEMRVRDNGDTLDMRGYMGVSLFGRTQTWKKATEAELNAAREKTALTLAAKNTTNK